MWTKFVPKISAPRSKVPASTFALVLTPNNTDHFLKRFSLVQHVQTHPYIWVNKDWQWRIGESNRWKTHLLPNQIHTTLSQDESHCMHLPFVSISMDTFMSHVTPVDPNTIFNILLYFFVCLRVSERMKLCACWCALWITVSLLHRVLFHWQSAFVTFNFRFGFH